MPPSCSPLFTARILFLGTYHTQFIHLTSKTHVGNQIIFFCRIPAPTPCTFSHFSPNLHHIFTHCFLPHKLDSIIYNFHVLLNIKIDLKLPQILTATSSSQGEQCRDVLHKFQTRHPSLLSTFLPNHTTFSLTVFSHMC